MTRPDDCWQCPPLNPSTLTILTDDKSVIKEVWNYVHAFKRPDHVVLASDDLYVVYSLCEEDLDEAVLDLYRICGGKAISGNAAQTFRPVHTVQDLAELIMHLLREEQRQNR